MLSKLPFEVACNVIQYLETTELLVCSTVCKEWREFVAKRQLIRALEPTTAKQLNSVIDAIKNQYIDGSQITHVTTSCAPDELAISFTDLPHYFPKLKMFEYNNTLFIDDTRHTITKKNVEAFIEWQLGLESLCILGRGSEMVILMENCLFERLVHLDIGNDILDDDDLTRDFDSELISALDYLPVLKSLTLHGKELSFSLLDQLHQHIPSLEKLELDYSIVVFPEGIPLDIAPADKLTHFTCNTQCIDRNEQFLLQYITTKYPSLVSLNCSRDIIDSVFQHLVFAHLATSLETAFLSFISQLPPTLKTFKVQSHRATKAVIDALAELPHVDAFYLCTNARDYAETVSLEYCHSTGFLQSLQELWISAWHFKEIGIDAEFQTNLKKLNAVCTCSEPRESREIFNIDRVFKVHPLLEDLTIRALGCSVDISDDVEIDQLKVKQLSLCVSMLSDRVIPFVRDNMPYLKQLSIEVRDPEGQEEDCTRTGFHKFSSDKINLPDHSLEYLKIDVPLTSNAVICSVSSIIDDKRKYYLFLRDEAKVKYCGMEPPNMKEQVYRHMDIYCKNLWHLQIGNTKIF